MGINSGPIHGIRRPRPASKPLATEALNLQRAQGLAMEVIRDTIPSLITNIKEHGGPDNSNVHAALVNLRGVFDTLSNFVLEPPTTSEDTDRRADWLMRWMGAFEQSLVPLGLDVASSEQPPAIQARRLGAIVERIHRILAKNP